MLQHAGGGGTRDATPAHCTSFSIYFTLHKNGNNNNNNLHQQCTTRLHLCIQYARVHIVVAGKRCGGQNDNHKNREQKKIIFSNLQRKNTTLITHERNKQAQCKPQKKNTNNNNSNKTRSAYIFVYNCMKNTISTTNRLIDYIRRVKRAEQRVMLTRPELNTV